MKIFSPVRIIPFCLLVLNFFSSDLTAQWSNHSFTWASATRNYRMYIPPAYNPSTPASLVLTLHGLGDNMSNFSGIGMNLIADTANIIVIVPQALADPLAGNAWNSGAGISGYYPNAAIDDIGFLNALVDTVSNYYAVNPARIYACGFSMGGFMTQRLACEANLKFAAFASVAGTQGSGLSACSPGRAIPVAHFHGTADSTVLYSGNVYGNDAEPLVDFWVQNNQCDSSPQYTAFPDLVNDGFTVDHYLYPNGQNQSTVEFYKINNAPHSWLFPPANDISYTLEIWKFFNKHLHQNPALQTEALYESQIQIFPVPASSYIQVSGVSSAEYELYSVQGALLDSGKISSEKSRIELQSFLSGMYILKLKNDAGENSFRVMLN